MKRLNSVALKLSLVSSLLVLGVIGLMAGRILRERREAFIAEMRVRAESFAKACAYAMTPSIDSFQLHYRMEEMMQEKAVVYAEVMDASGKILSCSDKNQIGDVDSSPVGVRAVKNSAPYLVQSFYDAKKRQRFYDIAVPVALQGHRLGAARLGFTNESVEAALLDDKKRILLIAVLATLAAVLGSVFIVHWIMRPLPLLARAAREIGQGNLKARVAWKSGDEIGVLARSFNEMAEDNARAFAMLTEEKEKLGTVFSETRDGLLWADAAGGILLMNPTARKLLGFLDSPPATLEEAFRAFEGNPPVEKLLAQIHAHSISCEFQRKTPKQLVLAGTCDRLAAEGSAGTGGLLIVLRDVTLERKEELLSRSVLSLISHKLRTPLTVSLGYQQLLEQGAEGAHLTEFQKKSLGQMRGQMEKLRYLVEKLLIFATVQNPDTIPLETALCLPKEIVERAVRGVQELIAEGQARIEYDAETLKYLPAVMADARHLTEALKNLIENAIKFNPKPKTEKKVKISAVKTDDAKAGDSYVRFSVTDNGPGIPSEEHDRLFRKFYQIDEFFTGQIEGMGLGLAYVKNVAQAHHGNVGLRSEVGKGSTFYFDIPCIGA